MGTSLDPLMQVVEEFLNARSADEVAFESISGLTGQSGYSVTATSILLKKQPPGDDRNG